MMVDGKFQTAVVIVGSPLTIPHGSPSGVRSSRSDLAGPPEAERTAKLQLIRPLPPRLGVGEGGLTP